MTVAVVVMVVVVVIVIVIVVVVVAVMVVWSSGADRLHAGGYLNFSGFIKDERKIEFFTCLERLLQLHKHQM